LLVVKVTMIAVRATAQTQRYFGEGATFVIEIGGRNLLQAPGIQQTYRAQKIFSLRSRGSFLSVFYD